MTPWTVAHKVSYQWRNNSRKNEGMEPKQKQYTGADTTGDQSILKEISPGISLEGMMLKLKLQYFGHLM